MATRLGVKIARFRRRRKMTQEQLAAKVGVSQAQIARLEQGERSPSFATLKKLAKVLDVEIGELVK